MSAPMDIDRRQRLAACLLLSAVDLPSPITIAANLLIDASKVCPGVTMGELPPLGPGSRRTFLDRAQQLIGEMIAEIDAAEGGR